MLIQRPASDGNPRMREPAGFTANSVTFLACPDVTGTGAIPIFDDKRADVTAAVAHASWALSLLVSSPNFSTMATPSSDDVQGRPRANGFLRITATAYVAHAIGFAILVGAASVLWKLPLTKLVVSYVLLVVVASGISVSMWTLAQPVRAHPKAYALRVALGIFAYTVMLVVALLFDATWLGLASQADALRYLTPLVNAAALISFILYFVLRKVFLARQAPGQP